MDVIYGFVIIAVCLFVYFLPTYLARNKTFFGQVAVLNIFLGWSLIGWVIALIWSLKNEQTTSKLED